MPASIYCASTQFLSLVYARDLGFNDKDGIVAFDDQQHSLDDLNLRPALVYALMLPPYGQYCRRLVDPRTPESLTAFIAQEWRNPDGFGVPYAVEIKKSMVALDAGFISWIERLGVKVTLPRKPRQHTGLEVSASRVRHVYDLHSKYIPKSINELDRVNQCFEMNREFSDCIYPGSNTSMASYTFFEFASRERQRCNEFPLDLDRLDWIVSRLAPYKPPPRPSPELVFRDDCDHDEPYGFIEGVGPIVRQWPGGKSAALVPFGIKAVDFDFWQSGRSRLPLIQVSSLARLLNAERRYDDDNGDRFYEPRGGFLLVGGSVKDIRAAYDQITHGGDVRMAFEILGPEGQAPCLRFLFFEGWSSEPSIILINPKKDIDLTEEAFPGIWPPVRVTDEMWEAVQGIALNANSISDPCRMARLFATAFWDWFNQQSKGSESDNLFSRRMLQR